MFVCSKYTRVVGIEGYVYMYICRDRGIEGELERGIEGYVYM